MAINDLVAPGRTDDAKVCMVLRRLLEQWREAIERVSPGETVYLPFDFSDQCTAFLRCRRSDERFDVVTGWSLIEGHCVSPVDFDEHVHRVPDFDAKGLAVAMTRHELLDGIDESMKTML